MEEYLSMYQGLDLMQQVFWGCAIVASFIFIIQFIFTLIGLDHADASVDFDIDADFDHGDTLGAGGEINLFSIKNIVNFFLGFGWAGVCLRSSIESPVLLGLVAIVVGCLFVAMFVFIYKQTRKLEKNSAFNIKECLDRSATVYLRIPAGCQGKGKVQLSLNGSVFEIDALCDEDEIPSGQKVKIVEIVDNETVKVINTQYSLVI